MSGTALIAVVALSLQVPTRSRDEKDRSHFLTLAVFEGLWEDGAKADLVQKLAKDNFEIFVAKCPICMPVHHAFRMMAAAPPPLLYDSRGDGLPTAIEAQLRAADLPTRKKGLEDLIQRYVERRLDRLKLTEAEKGRLQRLMAEGRKVGTGMLNPAPGDFCPSCEGAAKAGKP